MSTTNDNSMSLANPNPTTLGNWQRLTTGIGVLGLFILALGLFNFNLPNAPVLLTVSILLIMGAIVAYAIETYRGHPEGIKNNQVWKYSISSRGFWGWVTGVALTAFYIVLYFYPATLGLGVDGKANTGVVALFDPLSYSLKGQPASQWFVYGTLYTMAILAFGVKFLIKYRHNRYQKIRTISVMFFQLGFAFLIPEIMLSLNYPYYDLKNMWPLNYYLFYDWNIQSFLQSGGIGLAMLIFGVATIFIISPILTYFFGKRWYCSWVCGCGGLAETAGDPFRQLSSKKLSAWKFERWSIHIVLIFATLMTVATVYSYLRTHPDSWFTQGQFVGFVVVLFSVILAFVFLFKRKSFDKDARFTAVSLGIIIVGTLMINYAVGAKNVFFIPHYKLQSAYGFLIGAIFSGVIGTGFYPILGNRVWCRFGCPMAAILGMQQRLFSRFRITTNGGQCISCGNCSTYCEMGIDVRSYAQKGENIVRSSCVGCGICSAVCPRGVLKLENGKEKGRINSEAVLLGNDVDLMELLKQ